MDAARQSVGRVGEALGVALLLRSGPYLLQPDALPDLSQDVFAVVVRVGGQNSQLGLPQVETAAFEGGEHLVHGRARSPPLCRVQRGRLLQLLPRRLQLTAVKESRGKWSEG